MITPYLANKYDRMLSYYISKPVEDCLDPLPTPVFIRYIELLYELDRKATIRGRYKQSLSKLMIREFAHTQEYRPYALNRYGARALYENIRDKASLISIDRTHRSGSMDESDGVEVHDIYDPDFTFDSEVKAKRWLDASYLNSNFDPFVMSASYISIGSAETYKTHSYDEIAGQALHMLNEDNFSNMMDRRKTLKSGINNSTILTVNRHRGLKKTISQASLGLKSLIHKEPGSNTDPHEFKNTKTNHNARKRLFLPDNSEIKEETFEKPKKLMTFQEIKGIALKPKQPKYLLPLSKIKETTCAQYKSTAAFDRFKLSTNIGNVLKQKNGKGILAALPTTKHTPQNTQRKPTSIANVVKLGKKRSVSRNFSSTKHLVRPTKTFINEELANETYGLDGTAKDGGDRKYMKSCDKTSHFAKEDFKTLLQKAVRLNNTIKPAPKNKKAMTDTKKQFKDIRDLFWKKLDLHVK